MFVFNTEFTSFLGNSELQVLIVTISTILQINIDLIFINELYEGSTAVEGSISSQNSQEAQERTSLLSSNEENLGFEVLSSSVNVYYDDSLYVEDDEEEEKPEDEVPIGAIAGGAAGGLLVIGLILFFMCRYRRKQLADTHLPDNS